MSGAFLSWDGSSMECKNYMNSMWRPDSGKTWSAAEFRFVKVRGEYVQRPGTELGADGSNPAQAGLVHPPYR